MSLEASPTLLVVSWAVLQMAQVAQLAMPAVAVVPGRPSSVEWSLLPSLARESDPLTGLRSAGDGHMRSYEGCWPGQREGAGCRRRVSSIVVPSREMRCGQPTPPPEPGPGVWSAARTDSHRCCRLASAQQFADEVGLRQRGPLPSSGSSAAQIPARLASPPPEPGPGVWSVLVHAEVSWRFRPEEKDAAVVEERLRVLPS